MDRIIHKLIAVVVIPVIVIPVFVTPAVASIMLFYGGVKLILKLDRRTGGRPFRHRAQARYFSSADDAAWPIPPGADRCHCW